MKLNTDIQVLLAVLVGFVCFLLLDYTIILGLIGFPFLIYFLMKIKSESMIRLWITALILIVIASVFFSVFSFMLLMVAFFVSLFLDRTIRGGYTEENAIVYVGFMIGLMTLSFIIMLQAVEIVPSFDTIASKVIDWYGSQLNEVKKILGEQVVDMKVISASITQFFVTLPAQILILGFFMSLYTVLMVRVLNPTGKVWQNRPFMYWVVPRFVAHLYFIGLLVSLFITPEGSVYNVISNVMLILEWALFVHGLAFTYYFVKKKKMHTAVVVLFVILAILLRPITIFVGFMELILRLRLRMELTNGRK
ncbi:DUF2232 domain-containing protein [Phocicoccus schoeneichii]|uniref:DUF2232 domain-containing protein n=1 Tax=Phocicoccus schoeneichii TaxID=1812261 RepID=UPI003D13E2EF